jgi:hypothetical protein
MSHGDHNSRKDRDGGFERHAAQLFDESVRGLDAQTRSRLNKGRQRALDELRSRPRLGRWMPWMRWVPVAGVAAAAFAVMTMWDVRSVTDSPVSQMAASDFEILMDEESLEMLEDLEFYSWIELEADGNTVTDENVG